MKLIKAKRALPQLLDFSLLGLLLPDFPRAPPPTRRTSLENANMRALCPLVHHFTDNYFPAVVPPSFS
jgi:hypothetical protein